ncbi:MAG: hypothetical protein A3F54_02485 [Candidatus Kerfeldbacteria bacterium RIFCSPHIGHO2_12_FULL_48_17]|uniref:Uncharacterized protein n=1 Tax=Candidatus Kerfeldbacteria bacterium RIFCSPHIGHO2_12_FULL_48_17 TaxID=1798542 RepID=A0A1G2AX25_9BACT|nr:MAG: hypothetical protein A3F54_02485 [Candidatus Kerfeldbacteria bacterium RIFCSPHIGHO2_12_FULL_48_17]
MGIQLMLSEGILETHEVSYCVSKQAGALQSPDEKTRKQFFISLGKTFATGFKNAANFRRCLDAVIS